jgi:hypothetical protein
MTERLTSEPRTRGRRTKGSAAKLASDTPGQAVVHLSTTEAPSPGQRAAWQRLWAQLLAGLPPEAEQDEESDQRR